MHGNSREDLIYLAGLFDGEGSIMVVRQSSESFMKSRVFPYYGIVIRIGMTDKKAIKSYKDILGYGDYYLEKSYHRKRQIARWTCRKKDEVYKFLHDIGPFLRVKKENYFLALEFLEKCSGKLGRKITPEMNTLQHDYYIKMRALNGIDSPATTERTGQRGRSKGLRL